MALDSVLFIPEDKGGGVGESSERKGRAARCSPLGEMSRACGGRWEQNEVGGGQGTHSTLHPASLCFRSDAETRSS